jgi:hypothetical protein
VTKTVHKKSAQRPRANSLGLLFTLSAAVVICAAFVIHSKTAAPQKAVSPAPAARPAASGSVDSSYLLPVEKWQNRKFFALRKPPIFRKFGYEVYLTKKLSANTAALDTATEAEKHHARYSLLEGTTLTVTGVEKAGSEYLVTFSEEKGGRALFARTHNGAIEGLARADDLDSAARRWAGKTVYSRRRFIDTYDSVTGAYGRIKVKIQDNLKVTGVSWGLAPLPPKPLWINVETAAHEKGFIPVCLSWANVMTDKIKPGLPWAEELFETNPKELYAWDSLTWVAINGHTIVSGMNKEQVLVSWGQPHKVTLDTTQHRCPEQWLFGTQYLCFDHDTVISVGAR